jgi:hypothetical protein
MGIGNEESPCPPSLPEMSLEDQAGRRARRWLLLTSAGLLALAAGHLAYHYVLFTELGFRLLLHVGSIRPGVGP